jgi:hypothetical protein
MLASSSTSPSVVAKSAQWAGSTIAVSAMMWYFHARAHLAWTDFSSQHPKSLAQFKWIKPNFFVAFGSARQQQQLISNLNDISIWHLKESPDRRAFLFWKQTKQYPPRILLSFLPLYISPFPDYWRIVIWTNILPFITMLFFEESFTMLFTLVSTHGCQKSKAERWGHSYIEFQDSKSTKNSDESHPDLTVPVPYTWMLHW